MAQTLINFFTSSFDVPYIAIFLLVLSQALYLLYDLKLLKMSDECTKNEIKSLNDKIDKLEEEKAYLIGVVEFNGTNIN